LEETCKFFVTVIRRGAFLLHLSDPSKDFSRKTNHSLLFQNNVLTWLIVKAG